MPEISRKAVGGSDVDYSKMDADSVMKNFKERMDRDPVNVLMEKRGIMLTRNRRVTVHSEQTIFEQALSRLFDLDSMPGGAYIGDDFIPTSLSRMYDLIGNQYLKLPEEARVAVVSAIRSRVLDVINSDRVCDNHTGYSIKSPTLLADIVGMKIKMNDEPGAIESSRSFYWPGLDEQGRQISKYDSFEELKADLIDDSTGFFREDKIRGSPLLYALRCLYKESDEIKKAFGNEYAEYIKAKNPEFLAEVLNAIKTLETDWREGEENARNRMLSRFPESLHGTINGMLPRPEDLERH